MKQLNILMVEDSEDDANLLLREFQRFGYEVIHLRVETEEALRAALDEREWDVVLGDYTMPHFNGSRALSLIRERGLDLPFIFVSGTIGEDTAVTAMRAGAQDYINKGNLMRLVPAVEREIQEAQVRREGARAETDWRTSEARLSHILMMAADAVISVDESMCITLFNRGAEQIFGYTADEMMGQTLNLLLPERVREAHRAHIELFSRSTESARPGSGRAEVFGLRKDGSEFPAEATISKLIENGKNVFTVILRDITERKRVEQDLRLLQTVTQAASEAGDMYAALTVIMGKVCETTGWTVAQAWVPRSDNAVIECSPAWCCRGTGLEKFRTASLSFAFEAGEELPGRVWSSKQAVWIQDVGQDAGFTRSPFSQESGLGTAMGIPVLVGDEIVAVLEFFVQGHRPEDKQLIKLISTVAENLGSVIQRKRTEDRLHYLAHYDSLTGLPNRVLFKDRLKQAMYEANRHQRTVGVAFLDLDLFKTINDSLGHGIGDLLLKGVADRLMRCVREGDTVARLSGDEFTLILADMAEEDDAGRVTQRILNNFTQPFHIAGHELFTSASIGVTIYPFDDNNLEGLLRNADIAMYKAKDRGRNTCEFFSAEMSAKVHERLALENDLRRALERKEFLLHYQPLIDLRSGKINGVEALARWQHPERDLVFPAEFIPVAEETGLIGRLGEWVLQTACEQYGTFCKKHPSLRLSVNVSARQFQPDLPSGIAGIAKRTGFDPSFLDIEITESHLMQNIESTLAIMHKLNTLGVRFSVDDFGTGYSSLAYLKRLPIGYVKIDRSFIRGIPGDANDAAIVTTIISMAHNLGIEVIAEGVETPEQLSFLHIHGCNTGQGYYFNRPLIADELDMLLEERGALTPRAGGGATFH